MGWPYMARIQIPLMNVELVTLFVTSIQMHGKNSVRREYAMLARGVDHSEAFIHYAAPTSLFSQASLSLYEEIKESQSKVLMADLKNPA